jgi:hypothetical protein
MKWFSKEVEERMTWRWEFAKRSEEVKQMILSEEKESLESPLSEETLRLLLLAKLRFDVMVNLGAINVLYPIEKANWIGEYHYKYTGMDLYKEYETISCGGGFLKQLKRDGNRPSITTVHKSGPYPPREKDPRRHNSIVIDINLDRKKEDVHKDIDLLFEVLKIEAKHRKRKPWLPPKRPRFDIFKKMIQVYDIKKKKPEMTWSEIAKEVIKEATYETLDRKGNKKILVYQWAIDKVRHYWREANKMVEGGWRRI